MANVLFAQPNAGWQWGALADATGLNNAALFAAHSCEGTRDLISSLSPEAVVSALNFPDGDWRRILQLAQQANLHSNVIVVSQHEDMPLYLTAMESGAYDFATMHTSKTDLSWILRCAIGNSESRREAKRESPNAMAAFRRLFQS